MNLENELNSVFQATGSAEKENNYSVEAPTRGLYYANENDDLSRSQIQKIHQRK